MNRDMDEFLFGEIALVLLEIKPDLIIPTLFTGWHTESSSWSGKDVHTPLVREVVHSEMVSPMENVTLKTKDCEPGSKVNKCFREP